MSSAEFESDLTQPGADLRAILALPLLLEIKYSIMDEREADLLLCSKTLSFVEGGTLLFSAKESLFKALFYQVGDWFDFDAARLTGFNVYPNEIEDVVALHPGVFEVAAIGVRDEHSGEALKLFIVRRDPGLTEVDILAFCREQLTGYKRPKAIEFCDELPKSNVGKILRLKLRDRES